MNKLPKFAALAATIVTLVLVFLFFRQEEALVFGDSIDERIFLEQENPSLSFAEFVDAKLRDRLLSQFDIKTDDANVDLFIFEEAPDLVSAEKTRSDQLGVSNLADALQAVLHGTATADIAYESYNLETMIDRQSWELMLANDDLGGVIQSKRQFAAADTSSIRRMSTESIRPIYANRRIVEAICDIPEHASAIRLRVLADEQESERQVGANHIGVENFECSVLANDYLMKLLDKNVFVKSPVLQGYKNHIDILNRQVTELSVNGT